MAIDDQWYESVVDLRELSPFPFWMMFLVYDMIRCMKEKREDGEQSQRHLFSWRAGAHTLRLARVVGRIAETGDSTASRQRKFFLRLQLPTFCGFAPRSLVQFEALSWSLGFFRIQ